MKGKNKAIKIISSFFKGYQIHKKSNDGDIDNHDRFGNIFTHVLVNGGIGFYVYSSILQIKSNPVFDPHTTVRLGINLVVQ